MDRSPLPDDPPPFQWRKPPSPTARWTRRILVTSGLGALTGYLLHPWTLGDRRQDLLSALRNNGFFTGGIGRHPTFTHVDTRGVKADG